MSTPEELIEQARSGQIYQREDGTLPLYVPGDPVCTLTLDEKQAWILLVLLGPYRDAEEGDWEFLRATWDIRHRLATAMGVEAA